MWLNRGTQIVRAPDDLTDHLPLTRNPTECARRWQHSLDPSIDRSIWSEDEDKKLLSAVQRLGHNWTTITENEMPFRSPTDVRNRYVRQ